MTNAATIQKIIRVTIMDFLAVIQCEVNLLDEAPLDRHAAARLEIYVEQLAIAARKLYDLQTDNS